RRMRHTSTTCVRNGWPESRRCSPCAWSAKSKQAPSRSRSTRGAFSATELISAARSSGCGLPADMRSPLFISCSGDARPLQLQLHAGFARPLVARRHEREVGAPGAGQQPRAVAHAEADGLHLAAVVARLEPQVLAGGHLL